MFSHILKSFKINYVIIIFCSLSLSACLHSSPRKIAHNKIITYAESSTNPVPNLQDYLIAGVSGVTNENLTQLNNLVDGLEREDVDTVDELDALTAQLGINILPNATTQAIATNEDTSQSITLIGSDIDGNITDYTLVTQPSNGKLTGTAPSLTYTPDDNYNGADSFTFTVTDDDNDLSPEATVSIIIKAVNDAPTATAQSVTTDEDTDKNITLTGSDIDVDGSITAYTVVTQPNNGSLTGTAPNLTYSPNDNFNGVDNFTFTVSDNKGVSSTAATVSLTISAINDAPTATAQSVTTDEDTDKNITLTGSDIDVDGSITAYTVVTQPNNGSLTGTAPNLTYSPNDNFNGVDNFTFTVSDNKGVSSTAATISLTISAINDAPTATAQSVTTDEDTDKSIILTGSDIDAHGNITAYTVVTLPSNGSLTGTAPNLTYSPNDNFNGVDNFTFTVSDNKGVSSTAATISLTISAINDAPTATAQSVTTDEDTDKSITLTGSDIDGSIASYTVVTQPSKGVLTGTASNLTYAPNDNVNGVDSFTFTTTDNGGASSTIATVSLTINAINDVPTATSQNVTTDLNTNKTITLAGSDVENSISSYTISTQPSNGTLTGTAPNLTYTPNAGYVGDDSFTFLVTDGSNASSTLATISIAVNFVNTGPKPLYGLVVDGRVAGAKVWVDALNNYKIDDFEPFAFTDSDGYYSYNPLTNTNYCTLPPSSVEYQRYCLIFGSSTNSMIVRVKGGVDLSTGERLKGVMAMSTTISESSTISTSPLVLSPISTLLSTTSNPSEQQTIRNTLGITSDLDLRLDFSTAADDKSRNLYANALGIQTMMDVLIDPSWEDPLGEPILSIESRQQGIINSISQNVITNLTPPVSFESPTITNIVSGNSSDMSQNSSIVSRLLDMNEELHKITTTLVDDVNNIIQANEVITQLVNIEVSGNDSANAATKVLDTGISDLLLSLKSNLNNPLFKHDLSSITSSLVDAGKLAVIDDVPFDVNVILPAVESATLSTDTTWGGQWFVLNPHPESTADVSFDSYVAIHLNGTAESNEGPLTLCVNVKSTRGVEAFNLANKFIGGSWSHVTTGGVLLNLDFEGEEYEAQLKAKAVDMDVYQQFFSFTTNINGAPEFGDMLLNTFLIPIIKDVTKPTNSLECFNTIDSLLSSYSG